MKKTFLIISCILSMASTSFAQAKVPETVRVYNTLERLTSNANWHNTGGIVPNAPRQAPDTYGDTYYNKHWAKSAIQIYAPKETIYQNYLARFDVYKNEVDVITDKGVMTIPGNKVMSFVLFDSLTELPSFFINASGYKDHEGTPYDGLLGGIGRSAMCIIRKDGSHYFEGQL